MAPMPKALLGPILVAIPLAVSLLQASEPDMSMTWGVKLALRDGVRLNATVFAPRDAPGPLPVVFTLTPYIADTYMTRAGFFARNGYVFALVDARGRGNSEGEFMPFENEGRDGHDLVEALARQPWSSGQVAMWGGSYAGFDQWSTAKEFPPHLASIVPAAAAAAGIDFPFWKNISMPYLMQWASYTSGRTPNLNLFAEEPFWIARYQELFRSGGAFRDLDRMVGNPSAWFQKTLQHPRPDAYWKAMNPAPEDYARLSLPILTITGHYDDDQPGAMHYYRSHMRHGTPEGKARHYLILGPWDHPGTRTPKAEVGGLSFGPASLVDLNQLHKEWYDWTLKGGPRPAFLQKRIAYYVPGAELWKYADSLEAVERERRVLYLSSSGSAEDPFRSGSLSSARPAASSRPDAYVYDPLDLRPAEIERTPFKDFITDQRYVLNSFGNGVFYTGEPLAEDTELSGHVRLTAWIALDVPDTDLKASLYELLPDGRSVLLAEDQVRARYRESLEAEAPVPPGQVLKYVFDGFPFFSRQLSKGSRLRLFLRCPNTIYLQKNYNSGKPVAEETRADARTAHVTVYHDAAHPSALEVPVGR
jgi:putative CocE/NonD family hydrolase